MKREFKSGEVVLEVYDASIYFHHTKRMENVAILLI